MGHGYYLLLQFFNKSQIIKLVNLPVLGKGGSVYLGKKKKKPGKKEFILIHSVTVTHLHKRYDGSKDTESHVKLFS